MTGEEKEEVKVSAYEWRAPSETRSSDQGDFLSRLRHSLGGRFVHRRKARVKVPASE